MSTNGWNVLTCKCGAQLATPEAISAGATYQCVRCSLPSRRREATKRHRYKESPAACFDSILAKSDHSNWVNDGRSQRRWINPRFLVPRGDQADVLWTAVADSAGLDLHERTALYAQLCGLSREKALKMCEGDNRLRLQAAWRRLQRRLPKLRTALTGVESSTRYLFRK